MLRRRGLPIDLTLVGGAYPPALRRLRASMRRHDPDGVFVHYRGEVPYAELPDVYHRAEAFIFASSCENMPNVLLEAMAAGLPIACAARGPMPEILGDAAAYFDPEDAAAMGDTLLRFAQEESFRERIARLAHARAQRYTWDRCAAETLDFLVRTRTGTPAVAAS
jgi:glycosyltransferase involved in cell wall biosynthesis